jgi:Ca2+-binding RTX toxin-like protein
VIWGNAGNNTLAGLGGADYIDGGAGTDTASYAASGAGVNVSLVTAAPGGIGGIGGDAQGDTLVNIENLTGSNFDDTLEGNAGNNVLVGGLNGAAGDTVSYAHAASGANGVGVTVNLSTTSAQNTVTAGTDTLSGFENLTGSEFNDTLTGTSGNNVLTGLGGNDKLNGGDGNDTLVGGLGADTLTGGNGEDLFFYLSAKEGGDTIQDFVVTDDTLGFSASGFGGGLVAGEHLVSGTTFIASAAPTATTDAGTFLYNTGTHDLLWDGDGSGGGAAVQIVHFTTAVALTTDHLGVTV